MQIYKNNRKKYMWIIIAVIILALAGVASYFAKSYYDLRANPSQVSGDKTKELTNAVAKLYQLPTDEEPIVGKVNDKDKLKDQPFFKSAQNDDDILIYQKAKIAIIYRAKDNRLINVGPIAIDSAQDTKAVPKAN